MSFCDHLQWFRISMWIDMQRRRLWQRCDPFYKSPPIISLIYASVCQLKISLMYSVHIRPYQIILIHPVSPFVTKLVWYTHCSHLSAHDKFDIQCFCLSVSNQLDTSNVPICHKISLIHPVSPSIIKHQLDTSSVSIYQLMISLILSGYAGHRPSHSQCFSVEICSAGKINC